MAYRRTELSLEGVLTDFTTAAGALAPNSGISYILGGSSAEAVALAPPVAGCRKTIVYQSDTTTVGLTVRPATSSGGSITFSNGAAEGASLILGATSTSYNVVELLGLSSVQWIVTNVMPAPTSTFVTTY